MKKLLPLLLVLASLQSKAQAPFHTKEFINANNINALMAVHGDLWLDPDSTRSVCEFPNFSGLNIGFSGSIWFGGYDVLNSLHVSGQMYRRGTTDYWPGPIDSIGHTVSYATSSDWAKIWKVNRTDLNDFLSYAHHDTTNTPPSILTWPGKGNIYARGNANVPLHITQDMAPFADLNGNGNYEPLEGEYPLFYGAQTLWTVFNDVGPTHSYSHGAPVGVEVKSTAFAFYRGSLIDNVVYYDYEITNKSVYNYHDFKIGLWEDLDIGYYGDDYLGFDSFWRMGFMYNGDYSDGRVAGYPITSYGDSTPIVGVTVIKAPGDSSTGPVPLGSCMSFTLDSAAIGYPIYDSDYYNTMQSRFRDGRHLRNDFRGRGIYASGFSPYGPETNYIFTGEIGDTTLWSECNARNIIGERHFVLSTGSLSLNVGETKHILMALVTTNVLPHNTCADLTSFNGIRTVADTAWRFYQSLPPLGVLHDGESSDLSFRLYPNPAGDAISLKTDFTRIADAEIQVFNSLGQQQNLEVTHQQGEVKINTANLTIGSYFLRVTSKGFQKTMVFEKQ